MKLELWESVMVTISFGRPLTYAYAMLRQSVAGNSTFRGIVYCNLGTPKTVISNFVTTRQIKTPYSSPCKYVYPNDVPGGQKNSSTQKSLGHKCINSLVSHKLSHDR
jgi:Cdc6-like AAA superfamily ATPase